MLPLGLNASAAVEMEEVEMKIPGTGQEIRDLDGECLLRLTALVGKFTDAGVVEEMDKLLDAYAVPRPTGMFLHEKKLLYLRFIGAGRTLMHAVLD